MTNQFEKNSTGKNPKNRKEDFSVFEKNNKLEAKLSEKPANIAELERLAEEKELVVENQLTEDIKIEDSLGSPEEEFAVQADSIDQERKELVKRSAQERKELIKRVENKEEIPTTDEQLLESVETPDASESDQSEENFGPETAWYFVDTSEGKKEVAVQESKNNPDLVRINFGNRWSVVSRLEIEEFLNNQGEKEITDEEEEVFEEASKKDEAKESKIENPKSQEELMDEKFSSLSDGQKEFVKEGLQQLRLEEVRTRAKEKYNQEINNKEIGFGSRLWKKMTQGFQMAKLEKESFQEVKLDSSEHFDYVNRLADLAKSIGKEIKSENGKLIINFNNFEGLSKETEAAFANFNTVANNFSALPKEWSFESAKPAEQKKYQEAKKEYDKIKTDILEKVSEEKGRHDAIVGVNDIDEQIAMRQFLISNPEVQKEFNDINDKSPLKRMLNSVVAERGALTGAGFVARSGVKAAGYFGAAGASVVALPLIAMSIGGIRGRSRANKQIKEEDIQGRRNEKEEKSDLENQRSLALKELQDLVPKEFSFESQKWLDKIATDKEKEAYQKAKDNFVGLNQRFEKESGIIRDKKGDVKKIEKGLEANVSHSEDLVEKLNKEIALLEQTQFEHEQSGLLLTEDSKELKKLSESLLLRTRFIEEKLERGLVSFGAGPERSAKYLELIQTLGKASSLRSYTENTKETEERVGKFLDYLKGETSENRNRYKNKKMIQGALIGGAAFAAGALLREGIGLLSENEVAQATVASVSAKPKLTEAADLSTKPKVEEIHNGLKEIKEIKEVSAKPTPIKENIENISHNQNVHSQNIVDNPEKEVEPIKVDDKLENNIGGDDANNIEGLQHISNMDQDDEWQEFGPVDGHSSDIDVVETPNQEVELPENGVLGNVDEVSNREVKLPEEGVLGKVDEQLKNEFQKIPNMDGKQMPSSSVLENNIDEHSANINVDEVSGQEVKLPEESDLGEINRTEEVFVDDANQKITRTVESSEFVVNSGTKLADITGKLVDGAYFNSKGYDNLDSFIKQIQKLNGDIKLTEKEKEIAESVWKSWNQDYLQAVAKHPGGPVELYADPSLNLSRKALRIDLLGLEHKILDRLSKIKK